MILTRTHALYYAARKLPRALKEHAQDVTIDQVVNAHAPQLKGANKSEPQASLGLLRMIRKRERESGVIEKVREWANYGWPGLGTKDEIHGWMRIDKRYAYARKWAKKLHLKVGP